MGTLAESFINSLLFINSFINSNSLLVAEDGHVGRVDDPLEVVGDVSGGDHLTVHFGDVLLRAGAKLLTLLDVCVSSLRRGHANLPCIVPTLTDDPQRESIGDVFLAGRGAWS